MSTEVGELRAKMTAEAGEMRQAIKVTKKDLTDLGDEGKKTAKSFTDLSAVLDQVGANTDQLKKIEKAIKDADPAKLEKGLSEIVDELKRLGAESKQVSAVEKSVSELISSAAAAQGRITALEAALKQAGQSNLGQVSGELSQVDVAGTKAAASVKGLHGGLVDVAASQNRIGELTASLDNINARIELQRRKLTELKQAYANTFNEGQKSKLQEQILKAEASLLKLTQTSDQTSKQIWALEDALNQVGQGGQQAATKIDALDNALKHIGLNADQIKVVKKHLDATDPAKLERQLNELRVALKNLGVDSRQIDKITNELRGAEKEAQGAKRSIAGMGSALTALGAGAATIKLVNVVKSLADEAISLGNAYGGLTEVSAAFNIKVSESTALADKLADRWGLNKAAMAETIKTYITAGLTLQQTEQIITATADAAVYNRQAHLDWAGAIKQVAEGVKAGNSNLTDAAGITTNLSVMQERYAKSIGTSAAKLTESQKVLAAFNGIVQESVVFAGNADKAMTGYTGTQATFASTIKLARTELGEAFVPVLEEIMEKITPVIKGTAEWAAENKEMVAGAGAAVIAITSLVAIMGTLVTVANALKAAMTALNISIGPVGWVVAAISLLAAGITAYSLASDAASDSVKMFAKNQEELNKKLNDSPLKLTVTDVQNLKSNMDKLNEVMKKRNQLMDEYNALEAKAQNGQGTIENTQRMLDLADSIKEVDRALKDMDYNNAEEAAVSLKKMSDAYKAAIPARLESMKSELLDVAAKAETISKLEQLRDRYSDLSKKQKLDAKEKNELLSVINAIKKEMPQFNAEISAEGVLHGDNIEIINERIENEKKLADIEAKRVRAKLVLMDVENEAQVNQNNQELERIKKLQAEIKKVTANPLLAGIDSANMVVDSLKNQPDFEKKGLEEEKMRLASNSGKIKDWIATIDSGNYAEFSKIKTGNLEIPVQEKKNKGKTPEELAKDARQKAFQDEITLIRYKAEMYEWSTNQQIEAYEKIKDKHAKYLSEVAADEYSLDILIKNLYKQRTKDAEASAKAAYDFSSEWITMEERRLTLKGAKEEEITMMQLAAWARVRDRYEENSELYKRADTEVYNAKISLIKMAERAQVEAEKKREQAEKEYQKQKETLLKNTLDSIKKAEKAELASLDRRKREIQDFYDAQLRQMDDVDKAKERAELVAEIEKYRYATSREGREKLANLEKRLAELDNTEKKRQLQIEKDNRLRSLDEQRRNVEAYYDSIEEAFNSSAFNIQSVERIMQDSRYNMLVSTNGKMKTELQNFVAEYNKIMAQMMTAQPPAYSGSVIGSVSNSTSPLGSVGAGMGGGSFSGSGSTSSREQTVVDMMKKNSDAWGTSSDKEALNATNRELAKSIGATYNSAEGTYYKDGKPLYHSGGIAGEMNFRSDSILLPDELYAILKRGEPVMTGKQIGYLINAVSGAGGKEQQQGNTFNSPLIAHYGDVNVEGASDVKAYWSERELAAQRLLAEGIRDG